MIFESPGKYILIQYSVIALMFSRSLSSEALPFQVFVAC